MAASSENLAANIDPFLLRQSLSDYCWPTPSHDNETLTKALQQSIFGDQDEFSLLFHPTQQPEQNQYENRSFSPFSSSDPEQHIHQLTHPTPSPISASDHEATITTPKRRTTTSVNGKARITKRKSRATKKNQTTFFTADPANFRQMVQQVTGIRFDASASSSSTLSHLLKPETSRPVSRFYNLCLPTLDTSSFLLDHQPHQSQSLMSDRPNYSTVGGLTSFGVSQSADRPAGFGATDGHSSFPTLESWKVM